MVTWGWRAVTAVAMGVACMGCGNSFPGTWVSENSFACDQGQENIKLEVHDDLSGDGSFCDCKFPFVASDRGDDKYRLEIAFADMCVFDFTKHDCELRPSGVRLDCGKLELGGLGDYLREEE
jgi:hypothetical protein